MKKNYFLFFAFLLFSLFVSAQTTVTFTLGKESEDAQVCNYNSGLNYPNEVEYASRSWTIYGTPYIWRNFLKFDLSSIPTNATIDSAKLSLYYAPTNAFGNAPHSSSISSNESVLQHVTSAWTENTVTWDNQPTSTMANQVILPESISGTQDYPNMNVTVMVQQMISNPSINFGFCLKLTNEAGLAEMIFASGDNLDASKHPKLQIWYSTTSVNDIIDENKITVYPNPCTTKLKIESSKYEIKTLKIYDMLGQVIYNEVLSVNQKSQSIDVSKLNSGIYFIEANFGGKKVCKKITIAHD